MEATEIDEFSKEMKEGGENGLKHVSLAISVLAVLVAMVTVLGHRTHTEAVLSQTRASDKWNEYQEKKTRQSGMSRAVEALSLQTNSNDAAVQKQIHEDKNHIAKWDDELPGEHDEAESLESEVKLAERRADRYDLGEALLEIAVVMSSVTLLTRKRAYFIFGLSLGLAGLLFAASALLVH